MSKTQDLYSHAREVMPGGVGLLSKRPEMFAPNQWPGYSQKASGCEIWDLDGNHYYDMTTNGIGACLLGYANPDVSEAVIDSVRRGSMTSLNAPEEVYLADKLLELHPWAGSVRFARTGGETCAIAVRIARATTGRSMVAICGYHGWSDWYLAANLGDTTQLDGIHLPGLVPNGVPRHLKGSAVTFMYNDVEAFDRIIRDYGDQLACVIMEPLRSEMPPAGWLEHVRAETSRVGALLVFDEVTIGFRLTLGGVHKLLGVTPDIATFGKAMGNGHPIGAIVGTKAAMDSAEESFISSTFWTEAVGPAAALATIKKMEEVKIWDVVARAGNIVHQDWAEMAAKHNVPIHCSGIPSLAHFEFLIYPTELKTLYTALMLKEGFLANTAIYPTLAHTDEILALYREAMDRVFGKIATVLAKGSREAILEAIGGPVCHTDFARLLK